MEIADMHGEIANWIYYRVQWDDGSVELRRFPAVEHPDIVLASVLPEDERRLARRERRRPRRLVSAERLNRIPGDSRR
jgi:hypothetical protein